MGIPLETIHNIMREHTTLTVSRLASRDMSIYLEIFIKDSMVFAENLAKLNKRKRITISDISLAQELVIQERLRD